MLHMPYMTLTMLSVCCTTHTQQPVPQLLGSSPRYVLDLPLAFNPLVRILCLGPLAMLLTEGLAAMFSHPCFTQMKQASALQGSKHAAGRLEDPTMPQQTCTRCQQAHDIGIAPEDQDEHALLDMDCLMDGVL